MLLTNKHLLISSVFALGALHCGGGSTPPSNTPDAPASESATSGEATAPEGTSGTRPAAAINAADLSDSAPENSGAHSSMNLTDQQIAKITEGVHSAEIEQARLAQQKTNNAQVREFAAMMIEQHTEARQQQSALGLATEKSPLSEKLTRQSQATLNALESKQGADFDQAYIQGQIMAHQQVLETIRAELRPNAQNPQLQVYLQQLEPKVAEHLEHARHAKQSLQSSTANGRSSGTARSN